MLNGLIKLFYSEIVKANINNMYTDGYEIKDEYRKIRNITLKIDSYFLKILKSLLFILFFIIIFNINKIFAIGFFMLGILYTVYRLKFEDEVKLYVNNVKKNIHMSKILNLKQKSKLGIKCLMSLLIIGLLLGFNYIIVISFIAIFIFTLLNIC